jgi:predicted dehydrogenase/threonine dehydrogenase-like Zn-dependent dehydrogenase
LVKRSLTLLFKKQKSYLAMKQIIQNLNSGETSLIEVPSPMLLDGHLLIQSVYSLVSSGTERMLVEFGKANWLNKIRQQPEKLRMVFDKIKTDGLSSTIDAVKSKINTPIPLGYSNAGIVMAVGKGVTGFKIGDRVASNGAHAELVQVPQNLVAKIPDNVSDESAAFTVLGAIALQGIRLIQPSFGETVVVYGLGLIGKIAAQLLMSNGCRVIGVDIDEQTCREAEKYSIDAICSNNNKNIADAILGKTNQIGADAVLITASAKDDSVITDAARMSRKRGRIVLVGVIDLHLHRADFYEKELTFQVSCSYGPGRYDYDFEKKGNDYPIAFVRWTAQRNFEAVLQAMSSGQLQVEPLINKKIPLQDFEQVYNTISTNKNTVSLFVYEQKQTHSNRLVFHKDKPKSMSSKAIAIIGAGNFASKVIVPSLKKSGAELHTIVSANGLSAAQLAQQYGVSNASTDLNHIWEDDSINTVVVATQHNTHADLCIKALQSGKNVFVEKPLAISLEELERIKEAYQSYNQIINVGFNRRFAPLAIKANQLLAHSGGMSIVMTVNAGLVPSNHWLNDISISGGRIIGEVCHFVDLASFFAQSKIEAVCAHSMSNNQEDVSILLRFENGAMATINYFTNGHKAYDKERVELYAQGKVLIIENWKRLIAYGFKGFSTLSMPQNKGHDLQFKLLQESIAKSTEALIPFDSIYNATAAALAIVQSMQEQNWIKV